MNSDPARSTSVADRVRAAGFNPAGLVLIVIGALVVLVAYTILPWFRSGSGFFADAAGHSSFADLHDLLTGFRDQVRARGVANHVSFTTSLPYFSWLAWVLLLVSVLAGVLAASAIGARFAIVRVLCAVIALCAVAATIFALDLFAVDKRAGNLDVPSFGDFLANTTVGAWAAVLGYLLIMIACLLPRPRPLRV